jgi:hypothetical protein
LKTAVTRKSFAGRANISVDGGGASDLIVVPRSSRTAFPSFRKKLVEHGARVFKQNRER